MTFIEIQRKKIFRPPEGESEAFAIPAVSIHSPQGKKLIPSPHGNEAIIFPTLEEATSAIKRAGYDYIFEGKQVLTQEKISARSTFHPLVAGPLSLQKAVPILIDRLQDRESAVVANAAFALGELRAAEALPEFKKILGHDDPNVRKQVAEAMSKLGDASLPVLLDAFIHTNSSHTRLTILSVYLEMAISKPDLLNQFLPQVLEALRDENWLVRAQAALVLGHAASHFIEERHSA